MHCSVHILQYLDALLMLALLKWEFSITFLDSRQQGFWGRWVFWLLIKLCVDILSVSVMFYPACHILTPLCFSHTSSEAFTKTFFCMWQVDILSFYEAKVYLCFLSKWTCRRSPRCWNDLSNNDCKSWWFTLLLSNFSVKWRNFSSFNYFYSELSSEDGADEQLGIVSEQ